MAYWHRTGQHTFRPTEHVGGSWDLTTQHIAPALGVMAHEIELDLVARRDDRLVISRLSYDILGTVPMEAIEVAVEVLRPGRTIELVQATARHGGRTIVILRAWLVQPFDTAAHAGTGCPAIPSPDDTPAWPMSDLWPGGFIASAQVRRTDHGPGRSTCWVRTDHALVADEEVSRFAAVAGLIDVNNGVGVRLDPTRVAFPNLDLTAHFFTRPGDGWLGLDTSVSVGAGGVGLSSAVLHDEQGPIGTINQILTVRP